MKTLYFDCFAGASGNMILGGLLSLGIEKEFLVSELQKLGIPHFELECSDVNRSGISAVYVKTIYHDEKNHRHFSEIKNIIENSTLSDLVKKNAIAIFQTLANAEAKVHGISPDDVHFHEVGAMDAILDIVGACIGIDKLGIERILCSKVHLGSGFVEMAHGKYPVPPPAVTEILTGVPSYSTEIEGELITPTGAAIIKTLSAGFGTAIDFVAERVGYGAGTRKYERFPNVLRMIVAETKDEYVRTNMAATDGFETENLLKLETNLDDCSPEKLGFVMEKALAAGALDCWFTPIQMKKNRPSTMISVLCKSKEFEIISELLFRETGTLGVRRSIVERACLPREICRINTEFGEIEFKVARYRSEIVNVKAEFEQLRKISEETGRSFVEIEKIANIAFEKSLEEKKVVGK